MFSRILGNDEIKTILRRMIANGRVPRSLLLAGPEGVGKRQFAFELARAFVCARRIHGEGCGECSSCIRCDRIEFPGPDSKKKEWERIFLSEHTDVGIAVPYKNSVLVESVRDLEREANYRPYEAEARFFIIDHADKMNAAASNALLKTLEEPPATSYIILVTSRPDSLLQTIRSRCQTLRFAPVPSGEVADFIARERSLAPADAGLIAKLANGSVGRALSFDLAKFREQRDAMMFVIESVVGRGRPDLVGLLNAAETLSDAKFKDEFNDRLDLLQALVRDAWTIRLGGDPVNSDIRPKLAGLADKLDAPRLAAWIGEIDLLRERQVLNLNRKISADALYLGMTVGLGAR